MEAPMEPWMIEKLEQERRQQEPAGIPLYAPVPVEHQVETPPPSENEEEGRGVCVIQFY